MFVLNKVIPSTRPSKTVEQRSAKQMVWRSQVPAGTGTKVDVFGFIMTDDSSSLKTGCLQGGAELIVILSHPCLKNIGIAV